MTRLTETLLVATGGTWRPVASLAGIGLTLLAVAATWPTSAVSGLSLVTAIAAFAAATAHLLDEAAAEAADATPTTLRARTATRATVAVAVQALGVLGLTALAFRTGSTAPLAVAVQVAGCSIVALAAAAALRHRMPEPGEVIGGCAAALILTLAIARPFDRWVDLFPRAEGDRWAGSLAVWAAVAVASLFVLASATRDPLDQGR